MALHTTIHGLTYTTDIEEDKGYKWARTVVKDEAGQVYKELDWTKYSLEDTPDCIHGWEVDEAFNYKH